VDRRGGASVLIETLRRTQARIEQLTAGEVDAVFDRDGRAILLPAAQEQLRRAENERSSAILGALPANVACSTATDASSQ
jgi:hypothetical protein